MNILQRIAFFCWELLMIGIPQKWPDLPPWLLDFMLVLAVLGLVVYVIAEWWAWRRRKDNQNLKSKPTQNQVAETEGELVPLIDVAARTLIAARGRSVEPYLTHRANSQLDAIRLTAEAITRAFPISGRIPGTSVIDEIKPGTHSVYLDENGALYASDNFIEKDKAYIDLNVNVDLEEKITTFFREMEAPPFSV